MSESEIEESESKIETKTRPAVEAPSMGLSWDPLKEIQCGSVRELLAYLRVAKELEHSTIAFDDPRAQSFGFVDEVLDVSVEIALTTLAGASDEEKEQLGDVKSSARRAEAMGGSLDVALQAFLDKAEDAPETVEELEALWDLKEAVKVERVVVSNVDGSLAPPGGEHGEIPRTKFFYLQPLAESVGQSLTEESQCREVRSYSTGASLKEFAAELRTRRGIIRVTEDILRDEVRRDAGLPERGPGLVLLTSQGSRAADDPGVNLKIEEVLALLGSLGERATFRVQVNKDQDIVLRWLGRFDTGYERSVGEVPREEDRGE